MAEASRTDAPTGRASRLQLAGQFFLIPLVVVAIGVSVFVLFGLVADEERSPERYLSEIRSGSANRRWQAAWELSRTLQRQGATASPALVPQVIDALRWARNEDPQIRRYLVKTLGYLKNTSAVPVLVESLEDPDADTRLWAAEALGSVADPAASGPLARVLSDTDPGVRKQAVHSLGLLQAPGTADVLDAVLDDPVDDVRWNAALAMARLADARAVPVLLEMIDRTHVSEVPSIHPPQIELAMVTALIALGELQAEAARAPVERLIENDPGPRIRQAARRALAEIDATN